MRMRTDRIVAALLALVVLSSLAPAAAAAASDPYATGFTRWRGADAFAAWSLDGARLEGGALLLEPVTATAGKDAPGAYNGRNYYNGGDYLVGEALSPFVPVGADTAEAIASWAADTPAGSWVELQARARFAGGRLTKWYSLGIWAEDTSTVERHSVRLQGDADGFVAVDTLVLTAKKAAPEALQLKVRLFGATAADSPTVRAVSLAWSSAPAKPSELTPGNPARWGTLIDLPECSQMVYPDGGEVWCSPTSLSMVLAYWSGATGPCEPRVRAAVAGVYDWVYDGHGNWPFNTAHAAAFDLPGETRLEGYVARLTSLAAVEEWVAAGVPVVISYAWKKSSLDGAPISSSAGHLAVIVGFTAEGDPIVNDPAAASDAEVRRVYQRQQLESLWLEHSGGTVYLVYPENSAVPQL